MARKRAAAVIRRFVEGMGPTRAVAMGLHLVELRGSIEIEVQPVQAVGE